MPSQVRGTPMLESAFSISFSVQLQVLYTYSYVVLTRSYTNCINSYLSFPFGRKGIAVAQTIGLVADRSSCRWRWRGRGRRGAEHAGKHGRPRPSGHLRQRRLHTRARHAKAQRSCGRSERVPTHLWRKLLLCSIRHWFNLHFSSKFIWRLL